MKILIAPDKFKHALGAREVADAIAAGIHNADSRIEITCCPVGDGGEGTGRLLAEALGAEEQTAAVLDPLGREKRASWWMVRTTGDAIVEMAEASGIWPLSPEERDATRATSFGTGQLLAAAGVAGCRRVILCVGGSATVDGGAGALQALGWRAIDGDGKEITQPLSGGHLVEVTDLVPPERPFAPELTILCDVTNPLLGPRGAARVFAPQKGASPAQVKLLDAGLRHWATLLNGRTGVDLATLARGGAAGGLPAGLAAALGARLVGGFDEFARLTGLRDRAADCDMIITGEGRLDSQSLAGKVVSGVARMGRDLSKPVVAFVGDARPPNGTALGEFAASLGLQDIAVISPQSATLEDALSQTAHNLARAAEKYLRTWSE